MARFLFLTWDGAGNAVPVVAIASELQRRGHGVRVVGHATQRPRFGAADVPFVPYARSGDFVLSTPAQLPVVMFGARIARDAMRAIDAWPADLIIVDMNLVSIMNALHRWGLPYAVLSHTMDGFVRRAYGRMDPIMRMTGCRPLRLLEAARPVVVTSAAELDEGHGEAVHVGPVMPARAAKPSEPTILVSLSTYGFRALDATWRRILHAVAAMPVRVIATTGPAMDAATLDVPANVEVHAWLPHEEVMPRVSAVISHGGHGTTIAALAHGVPVLVLPLDGTSDQPHIGTAVTRAGVGLRLSARSSPERIRAAAERLLGDDDLRARAAGLGERIRAQDGRAAGADALIEATGGVRNAEPAVTAP